MTWQQFISRRLAFPFARRRLRMHGAEYLPKQGPIILVGNHLSYFDGPFLTTALLAIQDRQPYYPTKASVAAAFQRLFGRGALDAIGFMPLDMSDRSRVLQHLEQHLRRDGVIAIFPEGTRNKLKLNPEYPRTMLKGKTGAARLALATRVPVIPVAIQAPGGLGFLQTFGNLLAWWKKAEITFGPPVNIPQLSTPPTKQQLEMITRDMMQAVGALSGQTYPY